MKSYLILQMLFPAIQILYVHTLAGLEVDWTKYELLTDVVPPQDKSTIGILIMIVIQNTYLVIRDILD